MFPSFLKSGMPAFLHPMARRRSHVTPHSTSVTISTRVAQGTDQAKVLMASKRRPDEESAIADKDATLGMPRSPALRHLMPDEDQSQHTARDRVILERLLSGDTRALATLLLAGHIPGPTGLQCLALMLLDWSEAEAAVAAKPALNQELWQLPFRLITKSRPRKRGRRRDLEHNDGVMPQRDDVNRLVEELGYDAAIARVKEAVSSLIAPGRKRQPGPG
jgi:hypothetical protein